LTLQVKPIPLSGTLDRAPDKVNVCC